MNKQGYFSEKISENEQRIATLKGEVKTRVLSYKALENENKRLFEAMNNITSVIDTSNDKDKVISKLEKELDDLKSQHKKELHDLKLQRTQLSSDNKRLTIEKKQLQEKLDTTIAENNFLLSKQKAIKVSDDNIFKKIREES